MNERIEKLIDDAKLTAVSEMFKDDLAKFAELIIKDIFNVMNDQKTYNRCTYTTHDLDKAKCVVKEVIICVNEHFGTKL
jgi:hypothetical protein